MPDFGRWTSNGGDGSLNEINRADRFIEALSSNEPAYSTDPAEAELAFLLADWRDEVRETPESTVVTERDALLALEAAQSPRRFNRLSLAVVGSAAAAVMLLGGFGTAVYGAGPGDSLYGVRTMLFGGQQATRDDQVVLAAQTELNQVQQLVDQGQWEEAQNRLVALSTTVQSVDQAEQKQDLIQQFNALTYKVVEQDPAAALPPSGEPLPPLPDSPLSLLPVPEITVPSEAPTSTETASTAATSTSTDTSTDDSTSATETTSATDTPGPEVVSTAPSETATSGATQSAAPPEDSATETSGSPTSATSSPSPTPTSSSTVPSSSPTTTTTTSAATTTSTTTSRQPAAAAEAPASESSAAGGAESAVEETAQPTKSAKSTATSTVSESTASAGTSGDDGGQSQSAEAPTQPAPVTTTVLPGG